MLQIERQFRKALTDFHLLADGDHILVALSGGKDSLLMLELLAKRSRIFKPRFQVSAVHVRMENIHYETDTTYLETFCKDLNIPLYIVTTSFDATTDKRKQPCFLCAWNRRKSMFKLAQELGCNKIALGHHQDDLLCTALMNLTFEGHFTTMPVMMKMKKMPLTIIRPLALCKEADIKTLAEEKGYLKQRRLCPYEQTTNRTRMAELYRHIEELNPEARYSIWHALEADGNLVKE